MCKAPGIGKVCQGIKGDPADTWSRWSRRKGAAAREKRAGIDRLLAGVVDRCFQTVVLEKTLETSPS